MMMSYAIRRVLLLSAFRFGFVIGATTLFAPGFLLGILSTLVAHWLREWLQSWGAIGGLGLGVNLLDLLKLNDFLTWLNHVVALGWLLTPLVALFLMLVGGLAYGLATVVSASTYNFLAAISGGLVVELEEVGKPAALPPPSNAHPAGVYPPSGPQAQTPVGQVRPLNVAGQATLYGKTGQRWVLSSAGATLGSDAGSTIVLPGLLPRHAEIRFESNRYYVLYDWSNGQTWVDGRLVQRANLLKPGFQIRVGNHEFTFLQ